MIKRRLALSIALALASTTSVFAADRVPNTLTDAEKSEGWQLLFDGNSLDNWKASDMPGTFSVQDGQIVVKGPRSHLFYLGPVGNHDFKNFELRVDLMTSPSANSGVYFHTQWQEKGWPSKGYEVQVNNSHSDPSRTGGLWGVVDYPEVTAPDGQWQTLSIRVKGMHVVTRINGKLIVDYTQEEKPPREKGLEERLIASGTFALQGHDPGSETHYRNIKVKVLP